MRRCPECRKDYFDDSLMYCLDDGAALVQGSASDEPATAILSGESVSDENLTKQISDSTTSSSPVTLRLPAFLSRERLPWVVALVMTVIAAIFAYEYFYHREYHRAQAVRLSFSPPAGLSFNDVKNDIAVISPDGQKIAFSATGSDGKSMLYVRDLDGTADVLN